MLLVVPCLEQWRASLSARQHCARSYTYFKRMSATCLGRSSIT